VRIPLRHPPPSEVPPRHRCAHLEALAEASVGLPLGPAARSLTEARGRGRHGNALQWHFGLDIHDGSPMLDWEDRIEIKLVSVWAQGDGSYGCDKLKVCEFGVSPWHKLSNVLWIFADRVSRVVLGWRFTHLSGSIAESLTRAWTLDPHFGQPPLFVESRDSASGSAPAYYLAARWLDEAGVLPARSGDIGLPFDRRTWSSLRQAGGGKDPLLTVVGRADPQVACPRCGATMRVDLEVLGRDGYAPAQHLMPVGGDCALRGHLCILAPRLPSPMSCSVDELVEGVEHRTPRERLWRLADRVPEPEDHQH
jgi:hypothetical protein